MKFSKATVAVLKNFAAINSNILFETGKVVKTISPQRNILASTTVTEEFPSDFGIYDLNQFLGVLSLFEDPDVAFGDKVATIKEGRTNIKFFAADRSVLMLPPSEKAVKFPSTDVTFDMTVSMLQSAIKTAGVLSSPDISIIGENGKLQLVVGDLKNTSANSYNVDIGDTELTFKANLKVDNLKMFPQDYTVEISSKKLSRWTAKTGDMTVFVALESNSTF